MGLRTRAEVAPLVYSVRTGLKSLLIYNAALETGHEAPMDHRIKAALHTLAQVNDHNLRDVARDVGMSPSHFRRLFARETGVAPRTHVLRLRLKRVVGLLTKTTLSVKEIAGALHMDRSHLVRQFRIKYGCAPTVYRERAKTESMSDSATK